MMDIYTINNASGGRAWKTASMRGYVFKTVLPAETWGAGAYKITFREAANDSITGNPVDYDFYFNVDTTVYTGDIPNATNLNLDIELLRHILTANWQQGSAADYEAARDGTGTW